MFLNRSVTTSMLAFGCLKVFLWLNVPLESPAAETDASLATKTAKTSNVREDTGSAGFVTGSTTPLLQMLGDGLQLYSTDYKNTSGTPQAYWKICPTSSLVAECDDINSAVPNVTMRDFGVQGGDEGSQVTMPDGTLMFLFGDTNLTWHDKSSGRDIFYNQTVRGPDAIGYYPAAQAALDWSRCRYIEDLDAALTAGQAPSTASNAGCPALEFYKQTASPTQPVALYQSPARLAGMSTTIGPYTENLGPGATPVGAFFLGKRLYQLYQNIPEITNSGVSCDPHLHLNAILAKSTTDFTSWTQTSPPIFSKLYNYSQHGIVANCDDPADTQAGDPGKFIFSAPVVMSSRFPRWGF
jgi:hypothetical protein